MRSIFFNIFFVILLYSCGNRPNNEFKNSALSDEELKDTIKLTTVCNILINDSLINKIIKKPSIVLDLSDSCIFEILDSFSIRAKGNRIYYDALNSIYTKSDGIISEYFIDIMTKVFYSDYNGISEYLFLNRNENKLQVVLIEALSMDVSDANNPKNRRENILKIIKNQSKDDKVEKYMIELEKQINPKMFD